MLNYHFRGITKSVRALEKNFFHDPLTAGEKLFKLELSIQDFLLLGPVRLLPLGDRAFSFLGQWLYLFRDHTKKMLFSIVFYSGAPALNIPPCLPL